SRPLGGITTTIAGGVVGGAVSATVASAAGLQTGMQLFLSDGAKAVRVSITGIVGNVVQFQNTQFDSLGNPVPVPALTGTVAVTHVVLDVRAVDEGTWGNRLRVSVSPSGRISTTLDMPGDMTAIPPVPPGLRATDTRATLTSLAGIATGMTLFINDGTAAIRVRVTGIDEGSRSVQFTPIERNGAEILGGVSNGAAVTATITGKATTVLSGAVSAGASTAFLASTESIERGSVLL